MVSLAFAQDTNRVINHNLIQGRIQYDNSRYEEAIDWWQKVLVVDPENKEAIDHIKRAQDRIETSGIKTVKFRMGKPKARESIEDISSKSKIMKKRADKFVALGKRYYRQHRYKWAISEWQKALKVDPTNTRVAEYIERAETRLKQKDAKEKPVEPDMMARMPVEPEIPEPIIYKPKDGKISLEEAIAVGLKNHMPIKVAKEQVELSRLREREAFRELFPEATLRWDESSGVVSQRDYAGRKYQLRLKHPLYHGGELRYTWKQAKINLEISEKNLEKTKNDFVEEFIKAYYDLAKADNNFSVQEALLKELDKDMAMAKKEFDANLITLVNFLNIQSQYNQVYYAGLSSANSLSLARSNFMQLLSIENSAGLSIELKPDMSFKEYSVDLEKCIRLAYEHRTDLKINELTLKSAGFGKRVAKSQHLPSVDLTGTMGRSGEAFSPGTLQMSDEYYLGAKVNVPWGPNTASYSFTKENIAPSLTVFSPTDNSVHSMKFNILDNLAGYTDSKRAEVIYEESFSDLLKGKQTAATEVREAYFSYQESVLKVKNAIANKELYEKELFITKEKRLLNEAQTLDIISTKVKLATEESNYNSALADNLIAIAKLNKAIGIKGYFK